MSKKMSQKMSKKMSQKNVRFFLENFQKIRRRFFCVIPKLPAILGNSISMLFRSIQVQLKVLPSLVVVHVSVKPEPGNKKVGSAAGGSLLAMMVTVDVTAKTKIT
jgi:hypothetical protein